jgi:hypothetical protein
MVTDTLSITVPPLGARWTLPAVTEWTEKIITWTNPSGDIGGNLTLFIDNAMVAEPDFISPEKAEFEPDHEGWTFFDDFVYQVAEQTGIRKITYGDLHVYPNPAVDYLYLSVEVPLTRVDIYNSLGQLIKALDNPYRKIDVSELSSGIYMLNATDANGVIYKSKFLRK